MKAITGNVGAERQGGQREDIADHLALDLAGAIARDPQHRKGRVWRQALLHEVGLGERQFVIGRLQALVVEQRDLDRRVYGQRAGQQSLHLAAGLRGVVRRAHEGGVLPDCLAGDVGDQRHAAIRRE